MKFSKRDLSPDNVLPAGWRAWVGLIAVGLFSAAPLSAQLCDGFPSFAETRYRIAADAARYSYATRVGASVAAGIPKGFGTLGVARTTDAELDASTVDLMLNAGLEFAVGRPRAVSVCGLVAATATMGPNDWKVTETDHRSHDLAIALRIGSRLGRVGQVAVLPAAELRVAHLTMSRIPGPQEVEAGVRGWTRRDTYYIFAANTGFAFQDVWTVRPSLSVPFGLVPPDEQNNFVVPFGREEREVSLGITLSIGFGKRNERSGGFASRPGEPTFDGSAARSRPRAESSAARLRR